MNDSSRAQRHALKRRDTGTPSARAFAVFEALATRDEALGLQALIEQTGIPKPTLRRMLAQLEASGMVARSGDGRLYGAGARLRTLARHLVLNDTLHGARHLVLQRLVDEVGETGNITALMGAQVVYLDRVETDEPLRISLQSGSQVPLHCSASGKLFLAQMPDAQRRRILDAGPLQRFTAQTLVTAPALEAELARVRSDGFAIDDEELLEGLVCVAVLVPVLDPRTGQPDPASRRSPMGVAIQAPVIRLTHDKALPCCPPCNARRSRWPGSRPAAPPTPCRPISEPSNHADDTRQDPPPRRPRGRA
ncbi:MAG: IclR family transcriptional regulator [Burkholderiaceae bacterium]